MEMSLRRFSDLDFTHVGSIEPERDADGVLIELMPQTRYKNAATTPLHAYGAGPYCRFRIGRGRLEAGLYVVTLDEQPIYAGECQNLSQRWSSNGYGGISPRNCFKGGQQTNCRLNALVLAAVKSGRVLDLWFREFVGSAAERQSAETWLIQTLHPPWNKAKRSR